ncbi:MAG: hypothetical protein IB618_03085 [Candidatus Pacearchaeota archaeon]|nr:MAG: hypothetical protein IB618_03085 [Candidatus Pacearchaeota archaeon]
MPRISIRKEEKIKESILHFLFQHSPKALFTCRIAQELARDEEYMKKLLLGLEAKGLVIAIKKNPKGQDYSRRIRWRLDSKVYDAYKKINNASQKFIIDSRIL